MQHQLEDTVQICEALAVPLSKSISEEEIKYYYVLNKQLPVPSLWRLLKYKLRQLAHMTASTFTNDLN